MSRTYGQPDVRVRATSASVLWFQLNQQKSYSLHSFFTAQWLQGAILTQGTVLPLRTFLGVAAAGVKWNGPQGTVLKLDWRTVFTQQTSSAAGAAAVRNARHEPAFRLDKKWGGSPFTQVAATAVLNSYAAGGSNSNLLVDVNVSKFLFTGERVKLTLSARNLLNNRVYSLNSFSANTERQETMGRLPRFLLAGISVYPEKWK
ncbi:hypothetical protein [Hymenobacter algoricola]|uniref:TonB-dependent receptor n=1 Tax=Hymenobacter algoricola TaxID=486267 RepID=A0ABP7NMM2_9BACT